MNKTNDDNTDAEGPVSFCPSHFLPLRQHRVSTVDLPEEGRSLEVNLNRARAIEE